MIRSILENFSDAVWINSHRFRFSEVNEKPIIFRRADISRFLESVLRAVVQPDAKWPERPPLHEILDFFNFHRKKDTFHRNFRKPKPSGFRLLAPVFSATMFDTVKTGMATASEKLSHLRRFL